MVFVYHDNNTKDTPVNSPLELVPPNHPSALNF